MPQNTKSLDTKYPQAKRNFDTYVVYCKSHRLSRDYCYKSTVPIINVYYILNLYKMVKTFITSYFERTSFTANCTTDLYHVATTEIMSYVSGSKRTPFSKGLVLILLLSTIHFQWKAPIFWFDMCIMLYKYLTCLWFTVFSFSYILPAFNPTCSSWKLRGERLK